MRYDLLSILTPFLLKSAKKWDSAVQKTKSEEGGLWGGPENGNSDQISYFTPYCVGFGAVLYLIVVKESICESSEKIGPSVFVKTAVLAMIGEGGRFAFSVRTLIELAFSMPLSFRQSLVVPTQKILAF